MDPADGIEDIEDIDAPADLGGGAHLVHPGEHVLHQAPAVVCLERRDDAHIARLQASPPAPYIAEVIQVLLLARYITGSVANSKPLKQRGFIDFPLSSGISFSPAAEQDGDVLLRRLDALARVAAHRHRPARQRPVVEAGLGSHWTR